MKADERAKATIFGRSNNSAKISPKLSTKAFKKIEVTWLERARKIDEKSKQDEFDKLKWQMREHVFKDVNKSIE